MNKLKLFLKEINSDIDTELQDLNLNDFSSDKPLTHTHDKLINYKNAAQLALLVLSEEGGEYNYENIDSLCDGPWTTISN